MNGNLQVGTQVKRANAKPGTAYAAQRGEIVEAKGGRYRVKWTGPDGRTVRTWVRGAGLVVVPTYVGPPVLSPELEMLAE